MVVIELLIKSLVGFLISTFSLDPLLNWCWSSTLNSLEGLLPCLIGPLVSKSHTPLYNSLACFYSLIVSILYHVIGVTVFGIAGKWHKCTTPKQLAMPLIELCSVATQVFG